MPTQTEHDNRWAVLALLSVAQLMVVLDATIVTVALPSAQRDVAFLSRESAVGGDRLRVGVRQLAVVGRQAWAICSAASGR